ncbi:MAG: aminotransferase class I/II-fold pyridoxal phosphate-dependent enzyme [Solirubrobacteraceae bacterium]|nr:aminotransferase class I/II-fold pyridoxal phosphate-dependent enzyme [Patulibacter sp.]
MSQVPFPPDHVRYAINPALRNARTYPFQRLAHARTLAAGVPGGLIDLGVGEPQEDTPQFIRDALVAGVTAQSPYPTAVGQPALREAIATWVRGRYGTILNPTTQIVPTLGAKEIVYSLAQGFTDREGYSLTWSADDGGVDGSGWDSVEFAPRRTVAFPTPAYPVYEIGARMAGSYQERLKLTPENGWLPDLDRIHNWDDLAIFWVNSPHNPTGAVATLEWLEQAAELCRRHGVILACDEAYSELWFEGDAPPSGLQLSNLTGVLVINTLSKRSSMPGIRSGFVAGDPVLIELLQRWRPSVGTAPQAFVQQAAIAAWGDEQHVDEARERYRTKLRALQPGLDALGLVNAGGPGSFFRWLRLPTDAAWLRPEEKPEPGVAEVAWRLDGRLPADEAIDPERPWPSQPARRPSLSAHAAALLASAGIVAAPGSFFGDDYGDYVRVALVPTLERCEEAAERMAQVASGT